MELCIGATVLSSGNQTDHVNELAIVERCRRQDFEAFGKLVDAYQNRVFGFVRRMVPNPEEASDITQEVFIRAFQSFHRFDGRCSVRTWLFRIAYNLCIDRARKVDA
jgi:RNA polymerase sigma-70 factor, ECF subfamily